jgi:sterol desaturase/sphingolipid hydroxylase (fatty acid hydroxylase superfamily)
MDIINNFRSHPVDAGLKASLFALPVAMLGISPTEIIISSILSGFLVLMQHSDMDWDMPFVEKYLFIGAAGHRLHHSMDIRHQGKNLGYVVLWDWLFGTLHREDDAKVTIGIDDDPYHVQNSGRMTTELWGIYAATLKVLAAETVKTLSLNSGQRD